MNKKAISGEITTADGTVQYVNEIEGAVKSAPHFSQVVIAGDTAYLSGLIAFDPNTNKLVEGGIVPETEQTLNNAEAVLKGIGLTFNDVAKVSIYLTDFDDFKVMNEVYFRRFEKARPAREAVGVKSLAFGAKIEITITAYLGATYR